MNLQDYFKFLLNEELVNQLSQAKNAQMVMSILRSSEISLIGSGAYRMVYDLGDGKVLKLAKIPEGKKANLIEYEAAFCLGPQFAVKIFEIEDTGLWLIAEKVSKLEIEALETILSPQWPGSNIHWFPEMLAANARELTKPHKGRLKMGDIHDALFEKNDWYTALVKAVAKCKIPTNDLDFRNWGQRGHTPVLIDLGGAGY